MEKNELVSIGKAAKILNVSVDTLRRWDKSGKLVPIISSKGHRRYLVEDLKSFLPSESIFSEAFTWVSVENFKEPEEKFYCQNSSDLQFRIKKLENRLSEIEDLKDIYPLIVAAVGEIANNSFDHNLGNWPDVPGIFFAVDLKKRQIVLADRGQGILKTLNRVRPELKNDKQALEIAFTEIVSGRAPEERGNGLKFVRRVIPLARISLFFQTGNASLYMTEKKIVVDVSETNKFFRGCLALITF